jgi:hypothetical protein
MTKDFCDLCGNEVTPGDLHKMTIVQDKDGKEIASMRPIEICVFCKEKIVTEMLPTLAKKEIVNA